MTTVKEVRLAHMTQDEVARAIDSKRLVILPTGATEAHGPHMPIDTDSHQAEHIAVLLAKRIDAVVAPAVCYGVSKTFENFPGTISLSIPVYQELVYEVCAALIRSGFEHVLILNGNRPNGTANDAVARRLVDDLDEQFNFKVTAFSYWEPGAKQIHALRKSEVGGMGHAGEFETSFQLSVRPELVHMDRLGGVHAPLVGWDLVAPMEPVRTYGRRPRPAKGHAAIFGNPHVAAKESGDAMIAATVDALVDKMENLQGSYEERR
ncbi:creatininase family protein [Ferruginivarius sediminum]|uniref:Creatininase family protein n=1 Tax=Ferruginivarius sediminum TaxID=2661937 RepID=A0A369TA75_9PROT|nr:creatininase family protein [Ferruginivarius sediminum]RDD62190.1 creatininase family protein [Ferruginivarius sediminum]